MLTATYSLRVTVTRATRWSGGIHSPRAISASSECSHASASILVVKVWW